MYFQGKERMPPIHGNESVPDENLNGLIRDECKEYIDLYRDIDTQMDIYIY